ncbi:hypothetical protein DFH94DRAFT_685991 [Russula ochroleuca]|uniref:Uncharacterized protein n=1 Tax=Russula ochroleuca TaxID=152965 RepID=A0A9P5JW85_9AGAM|nr:hypothetical protein DFH94DRAFT_685991 [Russula ochroleuca]
MESYDTWFRNPLKIAEAQLGNIDFAHEIDFGLKQVFSSRADRCQYSDFMSGNWAWQQAETFKITFGVLIGTRSVYWDSLRSQKSVGPWMSKPRITRCGDGHLRRVIYGLGPYIADYPEQVLLACVVLGWCPKCTARPTNLDDDPTAILQSHEHTNMVLETFEDEPSTPWQGYGIISDVRAFTSFFLHANIHHLLSPDLLHQVIKGTFKDHLVDWVGEIAAVPLFPGLRRFPEGRSFKQWTGDDSKALMKVYLPTIAGHVPARMIDSATLEQIETAIARFQQEHTIFIETESTQWTLLINHRVPAYNSR